MNKDTLLSLVRTLLTVVGTYIVGHNILGPVVNQDAVTQIIGTAVALAGSIWGYFDKSTSIEGLQSALRSLGQVVGTLLVAAGKLSGQSLDTILGVIPILMTVLQSHVSKVKVQQLDQGKIVTDSSGKVKPATPPLTVTK